MIECPTCHQPTPEGNFCVRCGAPLDGELDHSRERHQFAAAPGQRRYAPWIVSSLFPQLPRHSDRHFRIALGTGAAIVVLLGVLRLFPVALITAALLMPLLTALYFYDVDIYESEPLWTLAWTLGWGAVTGVAVGIFTKAVAPAGTALIDKGSTYHVVTGGLLVPLLGVGLMLAGPLVLLPYRRFNDPLDGATFGSATAAMFAAAEAVVIGVGVLSGGVRPAGAPAPWVARLLGVAVATPVLSMSAIGAATAAIWVRYRAPVKDHGALGPFGSPPVAILTAAVLVIAGAVSETFMAAGLWLAWVVVLDAIGLVLLRRAIHVGLLEEEAEKEIGPEIRCTNCGAMTARHTFCGNCGIALKALPKVPEGLATAEGETAPHRGAFAGRLARQIPGRPSRHRRLVAFLAVAIVTIGAGFAIAALAAPPPRRAPCKPHTQCGSPPVLAQVLTAFPGYTPWTSQALGYSLRFNSSQWTIAAQDASNLTLQAGDGFSLLFVNAAPQSQYSPRALAEQRIATLQGQLLGWTHDTNPSDELLGSAVGLRPGPGGVFVGTVSSPQGPQTPVSVAVMASGDGRVSIVVTAVAPGNNPGDKAAVYQRADDIIDSIQWAGQ